MAILFHFLMNESKVETHPKIACLAFGRKRKESKEGVFLPPGNGVHPSAKIQLGPGTPGSRSGRPWLWAACASDLVLPSTGENQIPPHAFNRKVPVQKLDYFITY